MSNKLYDENYIQSIADAIRTKNGLSDTYKVSEMAKAVKDIDTADYLVQSDIPDYVKTAVLETAKKVNAVCNSRSIVFTTITDPHHATDEASDWKMNIEAGNLDACKALKVLSYILPLDFAVMLGDVTFGYKTTTEQQFISQCEEFHKWIDEGLRGLPQFWTPGNHDTGEYLAAETGNLSDLYDASLIKKYFADYNNGAVYGDETVGYCYRDFEDKKLRVITLNTVETEMSQGENAVSSMSDAQLLWFAQTLQSVGNKTGWGFMILGHYPLDWGYVKSAGRILEAYLNGGSVTISGTAIDYAGSNKAICYGNFHGHTHNFKADKIYAVPDNVSASNPPTEQMNVLRIAHPCSCFYRVNEVGQNNRLDSNYIEFGETDTYDKTAETANDTAFCINVINPNEKKIYSFCYGAGYDRTLSFDFTVTMHGIVSALTHCAISNPSTAVDSGTTYTTELTPDNGYTLDNVIVTMGGKDVTSTVYSNGMITIETVTGDIVITAVAVKPVTYTNLVNSAINSDGAPLPYEDNKSLSSSGTAGSYTGYALTGFIPLNEGQSVATNHIYRIAGDGITWNAADEYNRVAWYDESFTLLKSVLAAKRFDSSEYFPQTIPESATAVTFKVTDTSNKIVSNVPETAAYFRIGAKGQGKNLVITLDEEIN